MRHEERDDYQAWLWSTVLLIGLLGAALALFVAYPSLRNTYELRQARLVLDTAVMLAAAIVAVLAGVRFSVDGRRLDLLLCGGFSAAAASMLVFTIAPVLGGGDLPRTAAWAGAGGRLFAWSLIAAAPFSRRRSSARGFNLVRAFLQVFAGHRPSIPPEQWTNVQHAGAAAVQVGFIVQRELLHSIA